MILLALDAALARCSACVWSDGTVLAEQAAPAGRGHAALLPPMVQQVLAAAGVAATALDGVAVTVGPGSFTGLRATIALAQGLAAGAGVPVVGVSVAEALGAAAAPSIGARTLWVAIDSRRGRVFLDRDGSLAPIPLEALPAAPGPVALAGDAALAVAARLAARGADVMLTDARLPLARHVAEVAALRLAGALPPRAAQPIYVDPPEAKLPAGGLRPPPV
jgi:tRNA threonylcarbamoyladenosine biosynthesis protein TsaB